MNISPTMSAARRVAELSSRYGFQVVMTRGRSVVIVEAIAPDGMMWVCDFRHVLVGEAPVRRGHESDAEVAWGDILYRIEKAISDSQFQTPFMMCPIGSTCDWCRPGGSL